MEGFGNLFIDARCNLVQKLDDSDIGTHSLVDRGHFKSDDTTADDDDFVVIRFGGKIRHKCSRRES